MKRHVIHLIVFLAVLTASASDNYETAVKLIQSKEYKAAKVLLETEARENTESSDLYYALGYVNEKLGDEKGALLNYRRSYVVNLNGGTYEKGAERSLHRLMALKPQISRVLAYAGKLEAEASKSSNPIEGAILKEASVKLYELALDDCWDSKEFKEPEDVKSENKIELTKAEREAKVEKALGYNLRWHNRKAVQWEKNGHYYLYVRKPNRITWKKAYEECSDMGGYLVTITSAEENEFVRAKIIGHLNHRTAIGLTDKAEEGKMKWITGEPYEYQNWYHDRASKNPDNREGQKTDADRVVIMGFRDRNVGTWNDVHDDYQCTGFVCEWEK